MTIQKDYCSFFPDNIGNVDLSQCCKAHDEAYSLQLPKRQADVELFNCVKEAGDFSGLWLIAALMFAGVSVGGWWFYKRARVQ